MSNVEVLIYRQMTRQILIKSIIVIKRHQIQSDYMQNAEKKDNSSENLK